MKPRRGRKNRGKKEEEEQSKSPILFLPDEILVDILILLPIKFLIRCAKVCKTWRNLFVDHSRLSTRKIPSSLIVKNGDKISLVDLYVSGKDGVMNFNKPHNPDLEFVGSANGFLCFFDLKSTRRYYLCNPLTGKFLKGSLMDVNKYQTQSIDKAFHGFGYDAKSNQHMVIHISQRNCATYSRIYTFEINEWLNVSMPFPYDDNFFPVPLNGALHWIQKLHCYCDRDPITIFTIDMATKAISMIGGPIGVVNNRSVLGIHANRLCIGNTDGQWGMELWVLKNYGVKESWSKEIIINYTSLPYQVEGYSPELVMVLNDEEVLMMKEREYFFVYDILRQKVVVQIRIPLMSYSYKFKGVAHQVSFAPIPEVELQSPPTDSIFGRDYFLDISHSH